METPWSLLDMNEYLLRRYKNPLFSRTTLQKPLNVLGHTKWTGEVQFIQYIIGANALSDLLTV